MGRTENARADISESDCISVLVSILQMIRAPAPAITTGIGKIQMVFGPPNMASLRSGRKFTIPMPTLHHGGTMFSAERCVHQFIELGVNLRTVIVAASVMCCIGSVVAQQAGPQTEKTMAWYELYSWKTEEKWNFSVLSITDRQKSVQEVLDPKKALRGIEVLKQRISEMPVSSRIVWFDRLTLGGVKVKGSESLGYPPEETVSEIRQYAQLRDIEILGPPIHRAP